MLKLRKTTIALIFLHLFLLTGFLPELSAKKLGRKQVTPTEQTIHFPRVKIRIGKQEIKVELAKTEKQRMQGLMHRKRLETGKGMLFVFPKTEKLIFWMKNTKIPLSIAFFDQQQKILNILDMSPGDPTKNDDELPRYSSEGDAKFALEVPQGWFQKHDIQVGDRFTYQ